MLVNYWGVSKTTTRGVGKQTLRSHAESKSPVLQLEMQQYGFLQYCMLLNNGFQGAEQAVSKKPLC